MSPSTDLPPPGPERDRLVAEALGCTTWAVEGDMDHPAGCFCALDDPPHDVALRCSTSNHAAYDVLEAWKRGGKCRTVTIILDSNPDSAYVNLGWQPDHWQAASAPTLGDAASRAIIEAKRREG